MEKGLILGCGEDVIVVLVVNMAESGNKAAGIPFAASNTAGLKKTGVNADVHAVDWLIRSLVDWSAPVGRENERSPGCRVT